VTSNCNADSKWCRKYKLFGTNIDIVLFTKLLNDGFHLFIALNQYLKNAVSSSTSANVLTDINMFSSRDTNMPRNSTRSTGQAQIIWHDRHFYIATNIRFMRAIIMSTALYGFETWTLTTESEYKPDSVVSVQYFMQ